MVMKYALKTIANGSPVGMCSSTTFYIGCYSSTLEPRTPLLQIGNAQDQILNDGKFLCCARTLLQSVYLQLPA